MHNKESHTQSDAKAPFRGLGVKNPYKEGGMFEGASHIIFTNAKLLRKNMTDAEKALWICLKEGINGLKFRRQHPIGLYIADFYCHHAKFVVEIDGSIHNKKEIKETDESKQKELERLGYNLIRFTNQQVLTNAKDVVITITKKISELNNLNNQKTPQQTESKSPL